MKIYPLFKVHVDVEDVLSETKKALLSGYINEGVQVSELESKLKKYLGQNLVLLNSCTNSIFLALHVVGVGPGDDVVSTPMTCVATNNSIINRGANVVWTDIDPMTGMPNVDTIKAAMTPRTKAVIYVAWAGNLGELSSVSEYCRNIGVPLILDAAHAFGAKIDGSPVSDHVDYTCYSFQAIKHFTTGDGGALVTPQSQYHRTQNLRWFGIDRNAAKDAKGDWIGQQWDADLIEVGYKFNMNNLAAAIGLSQLKYIDDILFKHERNAALYDSMFAGTNVTIPQRSNNEQSARWVYTVRTPFRDDAKMQFIKKLHEKGIMAGLVHIPNDTYSCFKSSTKNLPGVREFGATQFSLPCGWWLERYDIEQIASIFLDMLK